ncbi:MAG: choice-of-anchor Q domain-containing protein, partial [Thermoleophilaceae bacterium]
MPFLAVTPLESVRLRALVLSAVLAGLLAAAPSAVAATRHVAPGGSLASAYAQSGQGDVIELAPGTYGPQEIPTGSKPVTVRAAPGTKVRTIDNYADNVTFDGVDVDPNFAVDSAFENHGAANVTFKNGRIGNVTDEKGALVAGDNFTFDNVVFHDVLVTNSSVHNECVYAIGVPGMTVRNSTFQNCATMDLFFTYGDWWTPLPPAYGNVTLENNVFGHTYKDDGTWHYYSLVVGHTGPQSQGWGTISGWVVRNNTFEITAGIGDKTATDGSRWVGNVGDWTCIQGMTFRYNVGKKCSGTDKGVSPASSSAPLTAPFVWVNPATNDFHLKPGSPAIDAADPADHPVLDRDGLLRDARPDAGAHEYGAK